MEFNTFRYRKLRSKNSYILFQNFIDTFISYVNATLFFRLCQKHANVTQIEYIFFYAYIKIICNVVIWFHFRSQKLYIQRPVIVKRVNIDLMKMWHKIKSPDVAIIFSYYQ